MADLTIANTAGASVPTPNTGFLAVYVDSSTSALTVKKSDGTTQTIAINASSPSFASLTVTGLTGAVAASRYVGATASGAPTSGTFSVGDFIVDQTGQFFICTTAGTPGTWTRVGTDIFNNNIALQSQVTVAGTTYYMTNSNLNVPTTQSIQVGTTFKWHVSVAKTAAGTGAFNIIVFVGTNGSTADTAQVTQSTGTNTAAVDVLYLDVMVTCTTSGSGGQFFWSMTMAHNAATATGYGIAVGTNPVFTGTFAQTTVTSGLKFGLGFQNVTGTPTVTVPTMLAQVTNLL